MNQVLNTLKPLRPTLYKLAPDGRTLDFLFAQCAHCDRLNFPANAPGCMHCGKSIEGAVQIVQSGGGTLLEYVTLHVPLFPGLVTPSIAGDIRIADHIVEEGILGVEDECELSPGMLLQAIAVALPSGEHYDCRFVPVKADADYGGAQA